MFVSCLGALGSIDDARAREALRASAADPVFGNVLPTVLRSIGRQRDAKAIPTLDAVAAADGALSEPVVGNQLRYELALAFARVGTPASHQHAMAVVGGMENPEKERLTIRDVGREMRRQMEATEDDERRAAIDAHLRALAEMYRALDAR